MTQQTLESDRVQRKKKPTKAFILSLAGGVLIFVSGATRMIVTLFSSSSTMPYVLDPAYKMFEGVGAVGGLLSYGLGATEAVSGIFVIAGAMMIHHRPAKAASWGNLILAFSFVSLTGTGGFMLGAVLGIVGGAFALIQTPNPRRRRFPAWPRGRRRKEVASGSGSRLRQTRTTRIR